MIAIITAIVMLVITPLIYMVGFYFVCRYKELKNNWNNI